MLPAWFRKPGPSPSLCTVPFGVLDIGYSGSAIRIISLDILLNDGLIHRRIHSQHSSSTTQDAWDAGRPKTRPNDQTFAPKRRAEIDDALRWCGYCVHSNGERDDIPLSPNTVTSGKPSRRWTSGGIIHMEI
jgi:hypothetical protein